MNNLVNTIFEEYAVLDAQIKALEDKKSAMRSQILAGIVENGKESVETPFGKFSYIALSKWTYPQEISDLEEELKAKQVKAKNTGEATCTETDSFKFFPTKI